MPHSKTSLTSPPGSAASSSSLCASCYQWHIKTPAELSRFICATLAKHKNDIYVEINLKPNAPMHLQQHSGLVQTSTTRQWKLFWFRFPSPIVCGAPHLGRHWPNRDIPKPVIDLDWQRRFLSSNILDGGKGGKSDMKQRIFLQKNCFRNVFVFMLLYESMNQSKSSNVNIKRIHPPLVSCYFPRPRNGPKTFRSVCLTCSQLLPLHGEKVARSVTDDVSLTLTNYLRYNQSSSCRNVRSRGNNKINKHVI